MKIDFMDNTKKSDLEAGIEAWRKLFVYRTGREASCISSVFGTRPSRAKVMSYYLCWVGMSNSQEGIMLYQFRHTLPNNQVAGLVLACNSDSKYLEPLLLSEHLSDPLIESLYDAKKVCSFLQLKKTKAFKEFEEILRDFDRQSVYIVNLYLFS